MKILFTSLALIFTLTLFSQIEDPVKWDTSVKKISDTEYELSATATIENGWHLYSQSVPDDGPIPTTFTFQSNQNYLRKGNMKEEVGHTVDDKVFNMIIKFFEEKATFKQLIKLKSTDKFAISAIVEFMVCNDSQCLAPKEEDLTFTIN